MFSFGVESEGGRRDPSGMLLWWFQHLHLDGRSFWKRRNVPLLRILRNGLSVEHFLRSKPTKRNVSKLIQARSQCMRSRTGLCLTAKQSELDWWIEFNKSYSDVEIYANLNNWKMYLKKNSLIYIFVHNIWLMFSIFFIFKQIMYT